MTELLEIESLGVAAGTHRILRNVSLRVAPGEILALTGESGSGKSMTALAVMGLLPQGLAARGAIRLDGRDLLGLAEPQLCDIRGREVAMIFQEPMTALNPVQTIGAQVMETIRVHGAAPRAGAEARAREVLERVGLPPDRVPLTRYPHELSGGQRQRVVIAMAIALRPRLLVADEPTTALDVTTQAQILELLRGLVRDEGMGLLMITHDLAVVAGMADRIAVMQEGEVVEQGPTADLFAQMRHPYPRRLFEASRHRAALPPPAPDGRLLRVEEVRRDYPLPRRALFAPRAAHRALDDVSFDIARGERLGLVGESGCGKSTLARAILGLEPVQGGTITLDGRPVLDHGRPDPEVRRRVQVVFQDPYGSFNPRHRVGRLVAEPFHLLPDPPRGAAREAAVADALTAVGLRPEHAESHIHAFSGGQRQRIAIARALIIRPELVIFDEAVSALDVSVRARILDLIAELSRQYGLTYLFISHDLGVVRSITDRVLVMRSGEIVERGATEEVFDNPGHWYTKSLVAAAPVLPPLEGGGKTDAGHDIP
ncbi:ABC transporter ATP-binding protein [Salipiger mucosus]|uniref:Peptide/opine/nickel uptake family ABC transporter, ATP-binding protein n=1 Tax=Salipiger mucosus DSM 16094 TaxID=1123237 RepID=S9Q8L3_9RHOB|nr:ABC transporter ATP-binding protein [Salipiger mucosus]EPX76362.1 Peptide/opine/nickel uptake family ABC transporter, ATP-binding protein [Salipiger mucosus DSM 16094]EPX83064.1 Peptide/opine/nickel uptake family ABC transporter, ATP-binding protein [Salipiger mucosus DSM 16094]